MATKPHGSKAVSEPPLIRNHAVEFPGSAAAPAAVRRALAPNTEAPGRTKRWMDSLRHERAARARPTAPEAGALPKRTAWIRLMLAISLSEALRDAVAAFGDAGQPVELRSPATPEAILGAIVRAKHAADRITAHFRSPNHKASAASSFFRSGSRNCPSCFRTRFAVAEVIARLPKEG